MHDRSTQPIRLLLAVLSAALLLVLAAIPAGAMTITWIRHGESYGNAGNSIDTSIPGPELTSTGQGQAQTVAGTLQDSDFVNQFGGIDAIYASTMIRTQQTAKPLSDALGKNVTILGFPKNDDPGEAIGVQEIRAGIFEGLPEKDGIGRIGYIVAPLLWSMGLYFVPVPGGESGLEFNERTTNALLQVEGATTDENGDGEVNAAVFSHGATIMMWTMMNVDNPDLLLLAQHQLGNTDVVVVSQNDRGGWHLESWAGEEVGDANYATKMFVNFRDLIVAPQIALYNLRKPVLTPDPAGIVDGVVQGVRDVGQAGVDFVRYSVEDTVDAIGGLVPGAATESSTVTATRATLADTTTASDSSTNLLSRASADLRKDLTVARSELISKLTGKSRAATTSVADNENQPSLAKVAAGAREQVRTTVNEARDAVKQSIKDTRATVRKAAASVKDAA